MDLSNMKSTFVGSREEGPVERGHDGEPKWTIPYVVRVVVEDEEKANSILERKPYWIRYVAAYQDDTIYALQECDWDEYDMAVWIGGQIVSSFLSEEDAVQVKEWVKDRTLSVHWEDLH